MPNSKEAEEIFRKNLRKNIEFSNKLEGIPEPTVRRKKGQSIDSYIKEVLKRHA